MNKQSVSGHRNQKIWLRLLFVSLGVAVLYSLIARTVGTVLARSMTSTLGDQVLPGIVGFVSVWVGGGLVYLLALVRQNKRAHFWVALIFYALPLLVWWLFTIPTWGRAIDAFTQFPNWKPLPALPEPAVEIEGMNAGYIYARGTSGKIYRFVTYPNFGTGWTATNAPQKSAKRIQLPSDARVPQNAVSTLAVEYQHYDYDVQRDYYALLSDGTVWRWYVLDVRGDPYFYIAIAGDMLSAVFRSIPFLIPYAAGAITVRRRQRVKWNYKEHRI